MDFPGYKLNTVTETQVPTSIRIMEEFLYSEKYKVFEKDWRSLPTKEKDNFKDLSDLSLAKALLYNVLSSMFFVGLCGFTLIFMLLPQKEHFILAIAISVVLGLSTIALLALFAVWIHQNSQEAKDSFQKLQSQYYDAMKNLKKHCEELPELERVVTAYHEQDNEELKEELLNLYYRTAKKFNDGKQEELARQARKDEESKKETLKKQFSVVKDLYGLNEL